MSWQVRFSSKADLDIEQALDWTLEHFGAAQRDAYQSLIEDAVREIADDPEHFGVVRRKDIHANARIVHIARRGRHARHFILYRIDDDGVWDIGRLLQDSMDLQRHLPRDFRVQS